MLPIGLQEAVLIRRQHHGSHEQKKDPPAWGLREGQPEGGSEVHLVDKGPPGPRWKKW